MLTDAREIKVYTPYGSPSDTIYVGWVKQRKVAFLARHGRRHTIPPYKINFRANVWALKELGIKRVLSPTAVGSLQPDRIKPRELVVVDQFFDRTTARRSISFYEGGVVGHVPFADPTCPELRRALLDAAQKVIPNITVHPTPEEEQRGESFTYVCIEGPRFSTRAESLFYQRMGFSIIGMTALTEAYLCREAEMCYACVGLVTDVDVYGERPVTVESIVESLRANVENVNELLYATIPDIPSERSCFCSSVLDVSLL